MVSITGPCVHEEGRCPNERVASSGAPHYIQVGYLCLKELMQSMEISRCEFDQLSLLINVGLSPTANRIRLIIL